MINIRQGQKADLPIILELIRELADYEKSLNQVTISLQQLERDGFNDHPLFAFLVAEQNEKIIGMALYYTTYSTWVGQCLFLEDLIVTKKMRNKGVGSMLFKAIIKIAAEKNMNRLMWQVLDWNKSAINFYKKHGAKIQGDWLNVRLTKLNTLF